MRGTDRKESHCGKAAFFDFDGTLTYRDTMVPFMVSALGKGGFLRAGVRALPWLAGKALRICSTQRAKEALFRACFKGMDYEDFRSAARRFAQTQKGAMLRVDMVARLKDFLAESDCVVAIVSASMQEWVEPFFENEKGITYLTTIPEVNAGNKLTGRFASLNCKGAEKTRRINEAFPDVNFRTVYAFGNSSGDEQMLAMAQHPHLVKDK